MGWGTCGQNPKTGEMMGYGYEGVCNQPNCNEKIDHGLSYVCGGMHEGGENGCGKYFCTNHLEHGHYFEDKERNLTVWLYDEKLCKECCAYIENEYFSNQFYLETLEEVKEYLWNEGWLCCDFCQDSLGFLKQYGCYVCYDCRLEEKV